MDDKAAGLRRVARALNIGTDSMVFCADNPAECDLIRQELPEVAMLCAGADPSARGCGGLMTHIAATAAEMPIS